MILNPTAEAAFDEMELELAAKASLSFSSLGIVKGGVMKSIIHIFSL